MNREKKFVSLFLVFAILALSGNIISKERRGAEIIVQKKNGATIKAELLTLKNNEIILMDTFSMSGITLKSDEMQGIIITKKSSVFKGIGLRLVKGGGKQRSLSFSTSVDPPNISGSKFRRLHLSYRPGYFRSQIGNRYTRLFKEIEFGDTKPAHEVCFLWTCIGTAPATDYPKLVRNRTITFEDVRLDYSITRKFAVGVGYSFLGQHEVEGYKYIPIYWDGESHYSELYLHENFAGKLYYVQFSWMPVPDTSLKKASFLIGAGAGLNHSSINYRTSKSSYEYNPDGKVLSINAIALIGTAEFIYYFARHLSLGFGAEYRYAPVKVESFRLVGSYYDLDEFGELTESTMPVNVPSHTADSGGFRIGLTAGFHF